MLIYGTKLMTKIMKSNYNLTESDTKFVATQLGYSDRQVRLVKNGLRGKRNTLVQRQIKTVLEFRSKQNDSFEKFCKKVLETSVSEKNSDN